MAETLSIAAAARLCGCPRSTLQRAIRAGRLHLDTNHQLDPDELTQAGYLHAPAARQEHAAEALQPYAAAARQPRPDLAPLLRDMQRTLDRLSCPVEMLTQQLQQRQQPHDGSEPSAYDPTKYILGRLCLREHDYQGTGQSLRRRHNGGCVQCNLDQQRERRQARRQAARK
jgi:hypothetical protein